MNKLTFKHASNTPVYCIDESGVVYERTLLEHVLASAEEVCSPRGREKKLFIQDVSEWHEDERDNNSAYALREWCADGKSRQIDLFDTEEEAKDEWFRRIMEYDFSRDDQRDTRYYYTFDDAELDAAQMRKEISDLAE